MIRTLRYSGAAIGWSVSPEFDGFAVTVPSFVATIMGNEYQIAGETISLENDGDTVWITPTGLVKDHEEEVVEKDVFHETGECYWLLSRAGENILMLEAGHDYAEGK